MANCSKCGKKLRLFDWKPNCPECGVNLMFYGFEDKFYSDAKVAELSLASVRVNFEKVKVGLIGGKLQIARLVCSLLPLLSLLLSFCTFNFDIGIYQKVLGINAINLYKCFTDGSLSLLNELSTAAGIGETASGLMLLMYCFTAVAAICALIIVISILGFISFKKIASIICVLSASGLILSIVTQIFSFRVAIDGNVIEYSGGFGCIAAVVAFFIVFFINQNIARKGLRIEYKPGDPERVAIKRKIKKGELKIQDLPFPVVQTEDEKQSAHEESKEAVGVSTNE